MTDLPVASLSAITLGVLMELYGWWHLLFVPGIYGAAIELYAGLALFGALLVILGSVFRDS